jgi:hypothetical protein
LHILSEAEKEPMRRSNGLLVVSGDNEILNANGAQALNPLGCATNRHLNISFILTSNITSSVPRF